MNSELVSYGVAAAITFLLLKEVFGFIIKMREKNTTSTFTSTVPQCSFTAHQESISRNLTDIRDGINKLVQIQEGGRRR
jgi:hypothetical protein